MVFLRKPSGCEDQGTPSGRIWRPCVDPVPSAAAAWCCADEPWMPWVPWVVGRFTGEEYMGYVYIYIYICVYDIYVYVCV